MLLISITSNCKNPDTKKVIPKCVVTKIDEFKKSSTCDNAKVEEYLFQGKTVYTFNPGTCGADMATEVIDAKCNKLGHLGGFVGNTKIKDEDFSNAKFVKTTWKK